MSMVDDIPGWRLEQIYADMVKEKKEALSKKLGRPIGDWGGKRKGAGRPKGVKTKTSIDLELNPIQAQVLTEMGEGSLEEGILKLINENM